MSISVSGVPHIFSNTSYILSLIGNRNITYEILRCFFAIESENSNGIDAEQVFDSLQKLSSEEGQQQFIEKDFFVLQNTIFTNSFWKFYRLHVVYKENVSGILFDGSCSCNPRQVQNTLDDLRLNFEILLHTALRVLMLNSGSREYIYLGRRFLLSEEGDLSYTKKELHDEEKLGKQVLVRTDGERRYFYNKVSGKLIGVGESIELSEFEDFLIIKDKNGTEQRVYLNSGDQQTYLCRNTSDEQLKSNLRIIEATIGEYRGVVLEYIDDRLCKIMLITNMNEVEAYKIKFFHEGDIEYHIALYLRDKRRKETKPFVSGIHYDEEKGRIIVEYSAIKTITSDDFPDKKSEAYDIFWDMKRSFRERENITYRVNKQAKNVTIRLGAEIILT